MRNRLPVWLLGALGAGVVGGNSRRFIPAWYLPVWVARTWPGCYGFLGVPRSDSAIRSPKMRFRNDRWRFSRLAEMIHRSPRYSFGLVILAGR